jgi:putative ABC transport system permease protein
MFKNYVKIALRNIVRSKFFAIINIVGLAMGMTVCLLIVMFVLHEFSYENFHKNKDQIYRICLEWGSEESKMIFAGSQPAIAPVFESQIPEVLKAVRVHKDYDAVIFDINNQPVKEKHLFFADPTIFEIFSFELLEGDKSSVLNEPFSAVISQTIAKKYFGNENPLGKTLLYQENLLKITGILEDVQVNTHLKCEILVAYSTRIALDQYPDNPWNHWGNDLTYILVPEDTDLSGLAQKMNDLVVKNAGKWFSTQMNLYLQSLNQIHWESEIRGDLGPKGDINYVYIFMSAALLILIIACFNFMNLSTSRNFRRMKEIGIRKVIGAKRNQLVKQFLTESFLIIFISIISSIALFEFVSPYLYRYLATNNVFETVQVHYIYLFIIGMLIIVGIIAGGYPALYLSKFKPIEIILHNRQTVSAKYSFRKTLIILQFAISIILILGSITIFNQLEYMKNSDLGFDKQDVLLIHVPYDNEELIQNYHVLRDELLENSSIISVSSAYTMPGINSRMNISVSKVDSPSDDPIIMQSLPADYGYVSSLKLKIVQGRDFSKDYSLDKTESVLLNQSAVLALNLDKPIGSKIKIPGEEHAREIIGVVSDFHIQSLHHKINPMVIYIKPEMVVTVAVKILPESFPSVKESVKNIFGNVFPDLEFTYRSMEEVYDQLYITEEKTGKLLLSFSLLAVFISCLGLLGLASLIAAQKTKEIGVRKVLGATTESILILFSKEFTRWIIVANIIAWPIVWFVMNKWLQNFAYRSNIDWWVYFIAGLITLIIALLTICIHAIRAAQANPIEALRYE